MPAMLRPKISAKIAFSILGKPSNMTSKPSALQQKIQKSLKYQDTRMVR